MIFTNSRHEATTVFNQTENVLKLIRPGDRVLDVGGGTAPFPRADAVLDAEPYEAFRARAEGTRRDVRLRREDWHSGDICHPEVWSQIPDKAFDFAICSHTLEDVRDPLYVCAQLQRVASAGYVETPSKFRECAKVSQGDVIAGWDHHRWIVEFEGGTLFFKLKNPFIHHFDFLGDPRRRYIFDYYCQFLAVHWIGSFDFAERTHKGGPLETEDLFLFFERYPYDAVASVEAPPVFHSVRDVAFRGRTLYAGHEYLLPIERECRTEEILKRHAARLAGEVRPVLDTPSRTAPGC